MERPGGDDFDPEAREQSEIGREMVDESTGLGSVMAHFYRGEMDRETTWRGRLDQTTNWAVTLLAAILAYAFSSPDRHVVLLVGMVVALLFLAMEARRYRDYDVYRSRIKLLQENLFANALDPSGGVERRAWRRELSEDLRNPTLKVTMGEAIGRRLRRVYLPLLSLLLVAWLFQITVFAPDRTWLETAAVAAVPGWAVVVGVGAFYAVLLGVAFWPRERQAKEAFDKTQVGAWKGEEEERDN
jgi:uncharacterized membrane protein